MSRKLTLVTTLACIIIPAGTGQGRVRIGLKLHESALSLPNSFAHGKIQWINFRIPLD